MPRDTSCVPSVTLNIWNTACSTAESHTGASPPQDKQSGLTAQSSGAAFYRWECEQGAAWELLNHRLHFSVRTLSPLTPAHTNTQLTPGVHSCAAFSHAPLCQHTITHTVTTHHHTHTHYHTHTHTHTLSDFTFSVNSLWIHMESAEGECFGELSLTFGSVGILSPSMV